MRASLFKTLASVTFCLAISQASGLAVTVRVTGINQLYACGPGGCGGDFRGTIDNKVVNLMCVDYQNHVIIPSAAYNANVTTIAADNSNLSNTRFGGGSPALFNGVSWGFTTSSINYTGGTLNLASDTSSALARYQMVGFLASNYISSNSTNDNRIQSAIWQLMSTNPPNVGVPGSSVPQLQGSDAWLSSAASWYVNSTPGSRASLLGNFAIVTNLAPQIAGAYPTQIQEFLTVTPEPRYVISLGAGLLAALFFSRRSAAANKKS